MTMYWVGAAVCLFLAFIVGLTTVTWRTAFVLVLIGLTVTLVALAMEREAERRERGG